MLRRFYENRMAGARRRFKWDLSSTVRGTISGKRSMFFTLFRRSQNLELRPRNGNWTRSGSGSNLRVSWLGSEERKMPNREFTPSSGNVFADLHLPHADDLLAKTELAAKIIAEVQRRRLTQSQ